MQPVNIAATTTKGRGKRLLETEHSKIEIAFSQLKIIIQLRDMNISSPDCLQVSQSAPHLQSEASPQFWYAGRG